MGIIHPLAPTIAPRGFSSLPLPVCARGRMVTWPLETTASGKPQVRKQELCGAVEARTQWVTTAESWHSSDWSQKVVEEAIRKDSEDAVLVFKQNSILKKDTIP